MVTIKINDKCKQYKKEDQMTKKSINMILERLAQKILSEGKDINSIYNKENIIYDRINDSIFLYKAHGINNAQFRIVYGFEIDNGIPVIYLIDYTNKKKNNHRYISEANTKFGSIRLSDMTYSEINCFT